MAYLITTHNPYKITKRTWQEEMHEQNQAAEMYARILHEQLQNQQNSNANAAAASGGIILPPAAAPVTPPVVIIDYYSGKFVLLGEVPLSLDDPTGELDYSGDASYTELHTHDCPNITGIYFDSGLTIADVKNLTSLDSLVLSGTPLTQFTMSGCPNLTDIELDGTELTSVEIFGVTEPCYVSCYDSATLESLNVSGSAIQEMDTSGCALTSLNIQGTSALETLYCYENQLTSLDCSTSPLLNVMSFGMNPLTSINIDNTAFVSFPGSQESDLDVGNESYQIYSVESISARNCPNLEYFTWGWFGPKPTGSLAVVDLDGSTNLKSIQINNSSISNVDISPNINLTSVNFKFTNISTLDVSNQPLLTLIACNDNKLSSLSYNIIDNPIVINLICQNNLLTELNISGSTTLETVFCYNNSFSTLDASNMTALTSLKCGPLTNLNISGSNLINDLHIYSSSLSMSTTDLDNVAIQLDNSGVTGGMFKFYSDSPIPFGEAGSAVTSSLASKGWSLQTA